MAQPFRVVDGDAPGTDLGGWDEGGNVDLPGVLTVDTVRGSGSSTPALTTVTFDAQVIFQAAVQLVSTLAALVGAAAGDDVLTAEVDGDAVPRLTLDADGTLSWSDGTNAADVNLYRSAANVLKTDDSITCVGIDSTSDISATAALAATHVFSSLVTGDAFDRWRVAADGALSWGPGTATRDTGLSRGAANRLDVTTASLRIATAGRGLQVAEGSNATMGTATLVGGTLVVSTTAVTANSRIFLTCQTPGGTPGFLHVSARSAGTSFTILSSSGTDTSVVGWLIVEPA